MKRKHPESDLQSSVATLLNAYEAFGRLTWFPVPNGLHVAGGTIAERGRKVATLKAKGQLRSGAPDIIVCTSTGQFGGIELKSKSGSLTEEQKQFRERIRSMGGLWALARSIEEVKGVLDAWTVVRRVA